jgi:hypothetical protein
MTSRCRGFQDGRFRFKNSNGKHEDVTIQPIPVRFHVRRPLARHVTYIRVTDKLLLTEKGTRAELGNLIIYTRCVRDSSSSVQSL